MNIVVNGEPTTIDQPCTVEQFLRMRGLAAAPCAVEINRQLVPKRLHEQRSLSPDDRIEIVTLVGGG